MAGRYNGPFPPGSLEATLGGVRVALWDGSRWTLAVRPQSIPGVALRGVGRLSGVTWDGSQWVGEAAGRSPAAAEAHPPDRAPWERDVVGAVHMVGGAVLTAYGLHPIAEAAGAFWREQGYIT